MSILCQFPGCGRPAFSGSIACGLTHLNMLRGHTASAVAHLTPVTAQPTCNYPGCTRPVYPGSTACSKFHYNNPDGYQRVLPEMGYNFCQVPGCRFAAPLDSPGCSKSHRDECFAHGVYKSTDSPRTHW
jgi:hypothetical protein